MLSGCPWETWGWETHNRGVDASFMSHTHISTYIHTSTRTDRHSDRIDGSFTSSITEPWHTMNTQRSLMWKPYCMWCVSMNLCVPFSLWWMCNEVAEASIQQFSIYELLTLERGDLNITPSWNNSTSLGPSPAPLSAVLLHKASHAKQMVWPVIQTEEEAGSINVLVESVSHSFIVFGLLDTGVHYWFMRQIWYNI